LRCDTSMLFRKAEIERATAGRAPSCRFCGKARACPPARSPGSRVIAIHPLRRWIRSALAQSGAPAVRPTTYPEPTQRFRRLSGKCISARCTFAAGSRAA
jgi:hypothetical protein